MKTGERVKAVRNAIKMSQAQLAKMSGIGQSTIADLERGRCNGSAHIAKIARALNVNPIWLTDGSGKKELNAESNLYVIDGLNKQRKGLIIEQYATGGSMGSGVVLNQDSGVIHDWEVSEDWVRLNLKSYSKIENLKIVTGFGDSMKGMFNSGDPLIIDIGVNVVDRDSPYFFRIDNEGFIKRLQRIPGIGIRAISANPDYEAWTITPDMDFQVFGLVLKSWQGTLYN